MYIKITGHLPSSLVNGDGIRTVIFFAGCSFRCPGCQNAHTWSIDSGKDFSSEEVLNLINKNADSNRKRVTFSGGDPFFQADKVSKLAETLHNDGYNIWCYTGNTFEDIIERNNPDEMTLLKNIDVLVDGQFLQDLSENPPRYRGSSNQRLIDVQKTLETHSLHLLTR